AAPRQISTAHGKAIKKQETLLTISAKETPQEDIELSIDRAPGTKPEENLLNFRIRMGERSEEFKRVVLKSPASQSNGSQGASGGDTSPGEATPATGSGSRRPKDTASAAAAAQPQPQADVPKDVMTL